MQPFRQTGTAFFCPSCMTELRVALPVEPVFSGEEVCALVPCTKRWLVNQHRYPEIVGTEPIYMLDESHRRHRMYTATMVRNLRTKRLAQYSRTRNKLKAPYEQSSPLPQPILD